MKNYCRSCDTEPASGRHSLPVDNNGDFIPAVAYVQPPIGDPTPPAEPEWGGVPSCQGCHDVHAAGGVNGPAALDAHVKATARLREDLQAARTALQTVTDVTRAALNRMGDG